MYKYSRMKNLFASLIVFCLFGCGTNTNKIKNHSTELLTVQYSNENEQYSLKFNDPDSVSYISSTKFYSTNLDKLNKQKLDSFIKIIKVKKADSIYFLPHLQTGGKYSVSHPSSSFLNVEFRYGDNKPKVFYDLIQWVELVKSQMVLNTN